jgi:hypothetical protein
MEDEERDEREQQPEVLHVPSLIEWFRAGQRKDAVLTMAEWKHALREYRRVQ